MTARRVAVAGVPRWVDAERLLGPGFSAVGDQWVGELTVAAAARVEARLRGVGLGGAALALEFSPPLPRAAVRDARLRDARDRRHTTAGFERPGVRLDAEGRWSLTPEVHALALGRRAAGRTVVDATAGCGGNAIGFARAGCVVTAIDVDPDRLALARHNAAIYGVSDRIAFVAGRAEAWLPSSGAAIAFVDPPWGRDWPRDRCTLDDLPALRGILEAVPAQTARWIKVPPSFDPACLPGATAEAWFGEAAGDRHRVKWVLLTLPGR